MNSFERGRRSLLFGVGGLGLHHILQEALPSQSGGLRRGYVFGASEGEHLVHFRDHGDIFIRVGSATGSNNLAMGTQQVMAGSGIPIHRHFQMDEAFSILKGSGTVTLDDVPHKFEEGATIFIPRNSWHGFANPDHELLLLWVVTPAGLDGFFRDTCNPPGVSPKQFTRDQIKEIALRYHTEFR